MLFEDLLYFGNIIMTTREWVLGQLMGQRAEGETHGRVEEELESGGEGGLRGTSFPTSGLVPDQEKNTLRNIVALALCA